MRFLHAIVVSVLLAAGIAAAQGKAEQELIQVEKDWCTASLKRDRTILDRILAAEYLGVTRTGTTETKAQAIASNQDTSRTITECTDSDFKVRIYGDTAVVIALATRSGTDRNGAFKDRKSMYTDTFVRRDGRWQAVASQSTAVSPK